jgi:hypothetical protein
MNGRRTNMQAAAAVARDFGAEDRKRTKGAVLARPPATVAKGPLMSWREVSRRTGKARKWIYRRAAEGAWGARMVGNTWMFRRDLVERWVVDTGITGGAD